MEMFRRTFAEISLDHLFHNYSTLHSIVGADAFFCPMLKANAYGHGDVEIAKFLQSIGAARFGVCLIEEGHLLRQNQIRSEILVFRGFDQNGAKKILDLQLTPVVSTWAQLEYLELYADEPVKIHLKFDTGMNRLGFEVNQVELLVDRLKKSKKLKVEGLLSHFHSGEDAWNPDGQSAKQAAQLERVVTFVKSYTEFSDALVHLLNSAGIANLSQVRSAANLESKSKTDHFLTKQSWGARPGLSLYGYEPIPFQTSLQLKPVMTLKSVVNNIRVVKKGDSISYGQTWTAPVDSVIAVVPIGYADGIHRLVSNRGTALLAGHIVPIVGRVCMDFLMLDVTGVIHSNEIHKFDEEEVILFGHDQRGNLLSADHVAKSAETISWEVLTSVGERVPRRFKPTRKAGISA